MYPYCSTNTPLHHSGPPDLQPLSNLCLTDEEWAKYRAASKASAMYKQFDKDRGQKLCIVGFNDDTKKVLRDVNTNGDEFIEVNWSAMDSLISYHHPYRVLAFLTSIDIKLWIGQWIEDKIHVPLHHWVLATSDGVIFKSFSELVCSSMAFRSDEDIVLTILVPPNLLEFVASHMKEHKWNRLTPGATTGNNARDAAKAEFHLIDPVASKHWKAYRAQQECDAKRLTDSLSQCMGQDLPFMYEKIEQAIDDVLSYTELDEEEADSIHNCVMPLSPDVQDDGWGNVQSTEVFTRIYSPICPAAVDIFMQYYHCTCYESVEFFCNIYYCAHETVAKDLKWSVPQSEKKLNGFKEMLSMGLKDMPPGRRWCTVEERSFKIDQLEVEKLHRVLFGGKVEVTAAGDNSGDEEAQKALNERVSATDMLELILGSVGVAFTMAREDGNDDEYDMGDMTWEGLSGSERWLGKNIRRVCGIQPMDGDNKDSEDEGDQFDDVGDNSDDYDEEQDSDYEQGYGCRDGFDRDGGCAHQ